MKHDNIIAHEGYPFIIFSLVITVFVAFFGIIVADNFICSHYFFYYLVFP